MTRQPLSPLNRFLIRRHRFSRRLNVHQLGFANQADFNAAWTQVVLQCRHSLPDDAKDLDAWQASATLAVLHLLGIDINAVESLAVAKLIDETTKMIAAPNA